MIDILIGFSIATGIGLCVTSIGWITTVERRLTSLESDPPTSGPNSGP